MTTLLASWESPGKVAIDHAWTARRQGADLRTTLERGLAAAEFDPALMAIGVGSLPNTDGELELDASMMDGRDLSAGAVCAVRGICPVISLARMVMEETPHLMLAGDQARRFAIEKGFKPMSLMTAENVARYNEWREHPLTFAKRYIHSAEEEHGDTVTMIAYEEPGRLVAASSTSGTAWKRPGRVGDSPIIGAGVYADDEVGAAGATGLGEELWRGVASFRVVEAMRQGMNPKAACEHAMREIVRRQPAALNMMCVVFAVDKEGRHGAACTCDVFPLWVCRDGEIVLERYQPIAR